jgi:hypothetical protein
MFTDLYYIRNSDYWPASIERLEDRAANNRLAKAKVYLIFLIRKSYKSSKKEIIILEACATPCTSVYIKPCKYNELECWIETSELQMEFYLKVMEMFC